MNAISTIRDLPEQDRPRERLLALGPRRLRDVEVLAVVIGSGTRGCSSLMVASRLLKRFGGPAGLSQATVEELQGIGGVGQAVAMRIAGAMELARRAAQRSRPSSQ